MLYLAPRGRRGVTTVLSDSVERGGGSPSVLRRVLRMDVVDRESGRRETHVLPDVMSRALARSEVNMSWFADAYDVPDDVLESVQAIARRPETRPAGITLRRMRERGWHASNTGALWGLSAGSTPELVGHPVMAALLRFSDAAGLVNLRRPSQVRNEPIADDVWLDAIELTMICCHRDEYIASMREPGRWNWTMTLRDDLPMIYFLVYLLTSRGALRDLVDEQRDVLAAADAQLSELSEGSGGMISREDADAEIAAARERARAEADAARAEAARLRKYVAALEHANEDLIRASELVDGALAAFEAAGDDSGVSPGTDPSDGSDASEGLSGPSEVVPPELPESGVVFLGGHTRVVRQLRQRHPGWRFVGDVSSAGALADGPTSSASVVFCWYRHLTHPTFDRVTSALPGVPVAYVSSTNIARLEAEMRLHYADILRKSEVSES